MDWTPLGIIAENIAYAFSIVGITAAAWLLFDAVIDKLRNAFAKKPE